MKTHEVKKKKTQLNFAKAIVVVALLIATMSVSLSGYLLIEPTYDLESDVTCTCVMPGAGAPSQDAGAPVDPGQPDEDSFDGYNGTIQLADWHEYTE